MLTEREFGHQRFRVAVAAQARPHLEQSRSVVTGPRGFNRVSSADSVLFLQRNIGNAAVSRMFRTTGGQVVQRCGPEPCSCRGDENAGALNEDHTVTPPVQRADGGAGRGPAADGGVTADGPENCGPGTANPFCLPIPDQDAPCQPFADPDHAMSVWASLSSQVPVVAGTATRCAEVMPVWQAYFAGTSTPFPFDNPSSCVVAAAKIDPDGSATAKRAADGLFKDIRDNLPVTLRRITPNPFNLGGPVAVLRIPLEEAIGPRDKIDLRPGIVYNNPFNAAANIAGAVGDRGEGSDIFGDDERLMGGTVVVEVHSIGPTGIMTGQVRWVPHVHVKDTVDFCPGNLGASFQRQFTVPMSKLEAGGLTRDVPITIDYDLDLMESGFSVQPLIGPLPSPPAPPPGPKPEAPRSGPAVTTGSLLRIRSGPGLNNPILGLLGDRGTPIQVITQVKGDPVDGNDNWDQIDRGFVSDRFVAFSGQATQP